MDAYLAKPVRAAEVSLLRVPSLGSARSLIAAFQNSSKRPSGDKSSSSAARDEPRHLYPMHYRLSHRLIPTCLLIPLIPCIRIRSPIEFFPAA